jgi:hypothetical protein
MHRLRLLLLLGLMFAVAGTLAARAQDGSSVFNDQDQKSDVKHDKAKNKDKNNDGRRKHWYSPPHWFHKKHRDASTAKSGKTPAGKTVAGKPASNSDIKPLPETKPVSTKAAATKPVHKTGAGTVTGTKSATATGQHKKTVAGARRRRKTVTGANQGKSATKPDCSPEQMKKGGCTADKSPQKSTATASAVKPS